MQMGSRKQAILERLHKKGEIQISDLAEYFGISEMTIRRDLESLEDGWICQKNSWRRNSCNE
jgi:DeoR/GlpR family transcriptional regulator of sugar metabolism